MAITFLKSINALPSRKTSLYVGLVLVHNSTTSCIKPLLEENSHPRWHADEETTGAHR
jgi:hypothetical protein